MKAGISDPSKCFFVDDSRSNVDAAKALGWGRCVHFCEHRPKTAKSGMNGFTRGNVVVVISDLEELREVWPEVFKNEAINEAPEPSH